MKRLPVAWRPRMSLVRALGTVAALLVAGACTTPTGRTSTQPLPEIAPSTSVTLAPGTAPPSPGADVDLDRLARGCHDGVLRLCDQLVQASRTGSAYERYGASCGGRNPPAGSCVEVYRAPYTVNQSPRSRPAEGNPTGTVLAVRANGHDGYDRFVLQFAPGGIPACQVEWAGRGSSPVLGATTALTGTDLLVVRIAPGGYSGALPQRITSDTANVTAAALTSTDGGGATWMIAVNRRTGFEVWGLDGYLLVVDISQR